MKKNPTFTISVKTIIECCLEIAPIICGVISILIFLCIYANAHDWRDERAEIIDQKVTKRDLAERVASLEQRVMALEKALEAQESAEVEAWDGDIDGLFDPIPTPVKEGPPGVFWIEVDTSETTYNPRGLTR